MKELENIGLQEILAFHDIEVFFRMMVVAAAEQRDEFRVAANGAFGIFLYGCEFMLWVAKYNKYGWENNRSQVVRQYEKNKGEAFTSSNLTDGFIKKIQYEIDGKPREKLNFFAPKKEFFNLIS